MLRRGCLVAIFGIVVGLGMVGGGVDIAARHYSTSRIEDRIRAVAPNASGVHAWIRGWPFLKVVINGNVDEIGARINRVQEKGITFSDFNVDVHGVHVQTGALLNGKVVVESIKTGTVSVSILASDLTAALGVPVSVSATGFLAKGSLIHVSVNSAARTIAVAGVGIPAVAFPLPGTDLLPCTPVIAFTNQAVTLSCTFDHVPSALTNVS
jgi:hypothetical protein